jgi:nucleotide-binding universal stress UspA family protein
MKWSELQVFSRKEDVMTWLANKKVVVPIDFSDPSIAAVQSAAEMVEGVDQLRLIHVLPELSAAEPGVIWQGVTDESRHAAAIKALHKQLNDPKFADVDFTIAFGDAGHKIVDFARDIGAGLIVMSSHGRTGMTRLLLGSVAERVTRLAHCPVMVLKHGKHEEE